MSKNMALFLSAIPALVAGGCFNYFIMGGSSIIGGIITAAIIIFGYRTLSA